MTHRRNGIGEINVDDKFSAFYFLEARTGIDDHDKEFGVYVLDLLGVE